MRLIDADALKKALHNFFDGKVINEPAYILRDVFCQIEGAPAVEINTNDIEYKAYCKGLEDGKQIARPKGRMIIKQPSGWEYCSECGKVLEPQDKFCWNCGAEMVNEV